MSDADNKRAARALETRRLVLASATRSSVHGHSFRVAQAAGGLCAACGGVLWGPLSRSCRCCLCGSRIHRSCHHSRRIAQCAVEDPPAKEHDGKSRLSTAAMRYAAMQTIGSTVRAMSHRSANRGEPAAEAPAPDAHAHVEELAAVESGRTSGHIRLWAGTTVAGTVAGSVVGSVVAGPAGALMGAKLAQAAASTVLVCGSAAKTGALVGAVTVGYRQRALLANKVSTSRLEEASRLANDVIWRGGSSLWTVEPYAARSASERAKTAEEASFEMDAELAAVLTAAPAGLRGAQTALFVEVVLLRRPDSAPGRLFAALTSLEPSSPTAALACSSQLTLELVAFHLDLDAGCALEAVDSLVFAHAHDRIMATLILELAPRQKMLQEALYNDEADDFEPALAQLHQVADARTPAAKLRFLVSAVELIAGNSAADDLLPRAATLLRSKVPRLIAELAFAERCSRSDFLGKDGYALTTLQAAVASIINQHASSSS